MTDLIADIRFALRGLRRAPGFTLAALCTLALGVGANTTIFSAVHAAVLADPPYPEPDQLWVLHPVLYAAGGDSSAMDSWSWPMYEAFRDSLTGLAGVAAFTANPRAVNLAGADRPQQAHVEMVTASYLPLLGVSPTLGRLFAPDEDATPGAAPVAVVSDRLWRSVFGGDSGAVGRTIRLDGVAFTVVGVLPSGFHGLSERADVFVPMMMAPALTFANRLRGSLSFWHQVVARIPDDGGPAADVALAAGAARAEARLPLREVFGDVRLGVGRVPLAEARTDPALRTALWVLFGAVGLVLLIACVNVANLLLARSMRRRREMGIRVALGAGRARLARQLLVESVVLAGAGGIAGLLLAVWGLDALRALAPPDTVRALGPGGVGAVLWFNFGVALAAGVAVGTAPAFFATRQDPQELLRAESPASRTGWLRQVLVGSEVALAMVLLIGAGLLAQSFARLQNVPLGFTPAGAVAGFVHLPRVGYDSARTARFYEQALGDLTARPGVRRAAIANCLPVVGGCDNVRMVVAGRPEDADSPGMEVWMNMVSPAYFTTMGIPILRGRAFEPSDRAGAPRVALVSAEAAQRYWPDRLPIGERIRLSVGWGSDDDYAEVVGVVGDVSMRGVRDPVRPGVYLAHAQYAYASNYLVAASDQDAGTLVSAVREAVRVGDPDLTAWNLATMPQHVAAATGGTRFSTVLLAGLAGIALLLAVIGIYGVVAFAIGGRTREIGIRMALGSARSGVIRLVFRDSAGMIGAGVVCGAVAALGLTRFLESQLFGVAARDPRTVLAVAVVLAAAAAVAVYVPARRAARVDPMEALRHD